MSGRPQPQKRKIPKKYLAGNPIPGPRSLGTHQAAPQVPPPSNTLAGSVSEQSKVRIEDWVSLRMQKTQHEISNFDCLTTFLGSLPTCLHGEQLPEGMARFEWAFKRKYQLPENYECWDCFKCCEHGVELDPKKDATAIENRQRVCLTCPECHPEITNPLLINAHLRRQGLGVSANKGLIENSFVTRFGTVLTKNDQWFAQGGGGKEMDDLDAEAQGEVSVCDVGHTSDTYDDTDGETVDETGDPVWTGMTDFTKSTERIRAEETRAALSSPSHYEVKQSGVNKKWFVAKDGDMLLGSNKQPRWFKSKRAAEQYVNGQLTKELAGERIEHTPEDVLPDIRNAESSVALAMRSAKNSEELAQKQAASPFL